MTQQDYNNQEVLERPENSAVLSAMVLRVRGFKRSIEMYENAEAVRELANSGQAYETASEWAKRSTHWAKSSNFLQPVVESSHVSADTGEVARIARMAEEIELAKRAPSVTENTSFNTLDVTIAQSPELASADSVMSLSAANAARARLNEIRSREVAA